MHSFKDNEGQSWQVAINIGLCRAVKEEARVDLLDAASGELISKLCDDPFSLADVLAVLCKEQIAERGLTAEKFANRLSGQALEDASAAVLEALLDFFRPSQSAILRRALGVSKMVQDRMYQEAERVLDDPATLAKIEASLMPGKSSTCAKRPSADVIATD